MNSSWARRFALSAFSCVSCGVPLEQDLHLAPRPCRARCGRGRCRAPSRRRRGTAGRCAGRPTRTAPRSSTDDRWAPCSEPASPSRKYPVSRPSAASTRMPSTSRRRGMRSNGAIGATGTMLLRPGSLRVDRGRARRPRDHYVGRASVAAPTYGLPGCAAARRRDRACRRAGRDRSRRRRSRTRRRAARRRRSRCRPTRAASRRWPPAPPRAAAGRDPRACRRGRSP